MLKMGMGALDSPYKKFGPLHSLMLSLSCALVPQLVIAFHMNAEAMGEFKKSEFSEGMLKMGVDTLDKLKSKLPELRAELSNPDRFHDIYNYAYMFSREVRMRGWTHKQQAAYGRPVNLCCLFLLG
mgnify:CR=1 FL=1